MVNNEEKEQLIKEAIQHIDRSIAILDDMIKEGQKNINLINSWLERNDAKIR